VIALPSDVPDFAEGAGRRKTAAVPEKRMSIVLNDFRVDPAIAGLMSRADWQRKRTDDVWLSRFPAHPESTYKRLPFVEFCGPEWAVHENAQVRKPELAILNGTPSLNCPPGDFDPTAGYIIGFTDVADAAICVDLRLAQGPRIIYDCLAMHLTYATAFDSIPEFVRFYVEQHGA
jgi:hypothetical protein